MDAFFLFVDRFFAAFLFVDFFFVDRFFAAFFFVAFFLFFAMLYGSFPMSARIMPVVFPLGATNRGETSFATNDSRQPKQRADSGDYRHEYQWAGETAKRVFLRMGSLSLNGVLSLLAAH